MRGNTFFGWKVVAAAFVAAVFAWGIGLYGPPVFVHALHAGRGWPVSLVAAAVTTHFLVSAGFVISLSDIHRWLGVATTARLGALALGLGALLWALADAPWQLFGAALVTGAGWGVSSGAAIAAMVTPWFKRRLPLAFGIAYNGASLGGLIFTPLWLLLIERIGFASTALAIGTATVIVLWLLAGRYLRPTPASLGLAPDGDPPTTTAPAPAAPPIPRLTLLRTRAVVTLAIGAGCGLFAQIGVLALFVTMLASPLGATGAAGAMSLATGCAIGGRLLIGWLPGHADWRTVSALNVALQAGGVLLLFVAAAPATILLGCVLFGLGLGNLVSLPALVVQAEFERAQTGRVISLVNGLTQGATSVGPAVFGALYDFGGGTPTVLAAAVALQLASAAIVLLGRKSTKVPA